MMFIVLMSSCDVYAADEIVTKDGVWIQATGGDNLSFVDGKIRFRTRPRGPTLWNIEFRKDGFRIVHASNGKLLGIDAKKKQLELFDGPGPTTTWQFKSAGAKPIPTSSFRVIISMIVGDEELRISTDDFGGPTLDSKGTLFHVVATGP